MHKVTPHKCSLNFMVYNSVANPGFATATSGSARNIFLLDSARLMVDTLGGALQGSHGVT